MTKSILSVENIKTYSTVELLYKLANQTMENTTIIEYLANDGIPKEVVEVLSEMADNGELSSFIDEELLGGLKKSVNECFYNVKDFNVKGDGETDDTEMINLLIKKVYEDGGGVIVFPKGVYLTNGINMKSNVIIRGVENASTYMSDKHPVIIKPYHKNVTSIFNCENATGFQISGVMIDGGGVANGVVKGSFYHIKNCHFRNCYGAIGDGNAIQSVIIENNKIDSSTVGVWSVVDSRILNNFINANQWGIKLGSGANDNLIESNKIEWNNVNGIECYMNHHNIINANIVDRSGAPGIDMRHCSHSVISNNVLRRNGAMTGVETEKTHLYLLSCNDINVNGNMTYACSITDNVDDEIKPSYGMIFYSNDSLLLTGNNLYGNTVQTYAEDGNNKRFINTGNLI